jgi:hypothetical protein
MKALTIRQPWAWLIMEGRKRIENRTWQASYRGPLLIHAGVYYKKKEYNDICERVKRLRDIDIPIKDDLDFGGIVGKVNLVGIVAPQFEGEPFEEGPYCWLLSDPERISFVPFKGKLGLFDVLI